MNPIKLLPTRQYVESWVTSAAYRAEACEAGLRELPATPRHVALLDHVVEIRKALREALRAMVPDS